MTTPAQPPVKGGKKKFPSMQSPVTWVVVLGIAIAGGAYLLYQRNKAAAAANTTSATTGTSTADTTDFSGQIATLQAEVADLQSSFSQDESAETTATSGSTGTTATALKAPTGFSITPNANGADFGWGKVDGAKAYELQVTGAGGAGTGTSHYDHAGADNHAEGVRLAGGKYKARVRAGASTTSLTGPWTPYKSFTVGHPKTGGQPPKVPVKKKPGEPED